MRKRRIVLLAATTTAAVALPSVASADVIHVVQRGESLNSIAQLDGLSEPALAAANGLSPYAQLELGQVIEIPARGADSAAASSTATTSSATTEPTSTSAGVSSGGGSYVVQPGDTLTGIAASDGTTVMELASENGLDPNGILEAGTTLTLPGAGSSSESSTSSESSDSVATSANQQVAGADNGPYPTDQFVDGPEVASIAEQYGVDPAFAEAIGWQESGWSNDEVSPTGAVGVMQIEPDTWNWIQQNESGGSLEPASANDNVAGGVLLLRNLISATGSDSGAAAAYYQGLGSVEDSGEFSSTRQYVADVMSLTDHFGG
jgi:N-acetylmuramoyl-L-alanine amidase